MKTELQIKKILDVMSTGIYEKEHIIAMALLSAIAGESIFLLGPPGTAKSLVARRLKLAFSQDNAFEYLMSRFSTPDEIFGPVSISLLKNEDRYERVVDGFMPSATVVFLDEIWKASPSIQNTLLTAINERIFKNGRETISLPMKALIAASNELPAEDDCHPAPTERAEEPVERIRQVFLPQLRGHTRRHPVGCPRRRIVWGRNAPETLIKD